MGKRIFTFIITAALILTSFGVFATERTALKIADRNDNTVNEYITPEGGADLNTAQRLISEYIKSSGLPVSDSSPVKEITTNEFWENSKAQIYCGELENYFAVIQDNSVVGVITDDLPTVIESVYIADLNNDDKYEVCAVMSCGSGMIDSRIKVLDVRNRLDYEMSDRFNANFDLKTDGSDLTVFRNNKAAGRLRIQNGELIAQTDQKDEYFYDISDIKIVSVNGEEIKSVDPGSSFTVECKFRKTADRAGSDYLFVAVYDKDGMLLSIDYVKADFAPDYDYSFGFNVPAQTREIGSVKAFVWSSFDSAAPLAETKTIVF